MSSPVSIWGYGLLWLSKPTSFFTERKQGNDSNQLAPDGTGNASFFFEGRGQKTYHHLLIKKESSNGAKPKIKTKKQCLRRDTRAQFAPYNPPKLQNQFYIHHAAI
jgi:hypothetical protein